MANAFSVHELLDIAQQIEKNGADFYREAARLHQSDRNLSFLLKLAEMEDEHRETFAKMQRDLSPTPESDPDILASVDRYLKALSDSTSLEGSIFATYLFSGEESVTDIILIGIDLEKETILYYLGLKDLFTEQKESAVIDAIIGEEKKHIVDLVNEYKRAKTKE